MDEMKPREKVVQKMTKSGAVEVGKATGKVARISAREPEAALKPDLAAEKNVILKPAAKKPGRAASYAAHRELQNNEDGNSGTEAAHRAEEAAEAVGRTAAPGKRRKLKQARAAAPRPEAGAATPKSEAEAAKYGAKPGKTSGSSPQSKAAQKKRIKRGYAAAFRNGDVRGVKTTAVTAKNAAAKAKAAARKTAAFVRRHYKAIGITLAIIGIFALLFAAFSSCGAMVQGGFQSVIATSYTSEDSDIEQTDRNYSALEAALESRIANIEGEYPGYDEYRYGLAEIGHDPFELASYLTAKFKTYTPGMVKAELEQLFGRQYRLTLTPVTETRYRTEARTGYRTEARTGYYYVTDPATGNTVSVPYTYYVQVPYTYYVQVPYSYCILDVRLENRSLETAAREGMSAEQAEMYDVYMETKGNKGNLFADNPSVNRGNRGEYTDYDIPPEALTDERFAKMIAEAEKYLGYPYKWGGSSPSTSFDCSGYVSWVVNHSGWNLGRLTANGLKNKCAIIEPSEARPGDLIFFQGTYATSGASHVGIYVGGGMMIHCGNPISYASVETSYWKNHFFCYGRLP
jgi:hypothetical protein